MAAFLAAHRRVGRGELEDSGLNAVGRRVAVVDAVLTEKVITALHAEGAGMEVERHAKVELPCEGTRRKYRPGARSLKR
jgi:hypothetical protein